MIEVRCHLEIESLGARESDNTIGEVFALPIDNLGLILGIPCGP